MREGLVNWIRFAGKVVFYVLAGWLICLYIIAKTINCYVAHKEYHDDYNGKCNKCGRKWNGYGIGAGMP